jgi:hypothetical protein
MNTKYSARTAAALLITLVLAAPARADTPAPGDWTHDRQPLPLDGTLHHRPARACLQKDSVLERLEFANLFASKLLLRIPDAWARQLSDFDRGVRQRTLAPTSTRGFLEFASGAAAGWTSAEIASWKPLVARLSTAAKGLNVRLPYVFLVKTTGAEEFDAAYTRGHAIFIPQRLASLAVTDERNAFFLLAHELFHIISRVNPAHREKLYALLELERVDGFTYPPELEERRLSNPDAFEYEHALTVETAGGPVSVLPINQSRVPLAEAIELPSIFEALDIALLAVDPASGAVLRDAGGAVIAYNFGNTDWVPRMLRNSSFIIHGEEVLADNFATMMETRSTGVLAPTNPGGFPNNDPGLLLDMEEQLTGGCPRKSR